MDLKAKIEAEIARIDSIRTDNEASQLLFRGHLVGLRWALEELKREEQLDSTRAISKLGAFEAFQGYTIQSLKNGSKLTDISPLELEDLIDFVSVFRL